MAGTGKLCSKRLPQNRKKYLLLIYFVSRELKLSALSHNQFAEVVRRNPTQKHINVAATVVVAATATREKKCFQFFFMNFCAESFA